MRAVKYAVLSDIHSNLEALQTALDYLADKQIDQYLILGDIVGYAANPNECLGLISKLPARIVAGNHDKAALDLTQAAGFNDAAYEAICWTKDCLAAEWSSFLNNLPLMHIASNCTIAHGSMDCPEAFHYLFYFDDALPSFQRLETPLGWIGHTHVPQIFMKKERMTSYLKEGTYPLDRNETYLINPGSIGQPRDHDPRLSFAIFDEQDYQLEIVRLGYDNQKTAQKIRAAGLPEYLASRLL